MTGERCARCGHPADWHRHDDSDNTPPTSPSCKFRCLGYDCMAPGFPDPDPRFEYGRACDCPDFEEPSSYCHAIGVRGLCDLPTEHRGLHDNGDGYQWGNRDDLDRVAGERAEAQS